MNAAPRIPHDTRLHPAVCLAIIFGGSAVMWWGIVAAVRALWTLL